LEYLGKTVIPHFIQFPENVVRLESPSMRVKNASGRLTKPFLRLLAQIFPGLLSIYQTLDDVVILELSSAAFKANSKRLEGTAFRVLNILCLLYNCDETVSEEDEEHEKSKKYRPSYKQVQRPMTLSPGSRILNKEGGQSTLGIFLVPRTDNSFSSLRGTCDVPVHHFTV